MTPPRVDLDPYLARPTVVERHVRRLLWLRPRPVLLDIGACEGEDSIRYARIFPAARIFAFEALPANQESIRANFQRYGIANAELIPLALSDQSGTATFHVSSGQPENLHMGENWNYGNKSSSLLPPVAEGPMHGWVNFKEAITVQCDTLDHFCAERRLEQVDFIHLDVQGAESLVLAGAGEAIGRTLSIWLEVANQELYRGQKLRPEQEAFFKARGFRLLYQEDGGAEGDQFYVNVRTFRGFAFALFYNTVGATRRWLANLFKAK